MYRVGSRLTAGKQEEEFFERYAKLIEIKNLTLQLGQKEIFTGLNLDVKRGEKVGIIGSEGSGKSSLLDIIAGRLPPTSGSARVTGEVLLVTGSAYSDFSELHMAEMSAIDKLKRALRGLKDSEVVLLLDEPTKNLDAGGVEWLIDFLKTRQDLTAVIVSNDRYFLWSSCKEIIPLGEKKVTPINLQCDEDFTAVDPKDLSTPIVLEVEDLLKVRDGETIFQNVSFTIRRGQKIALVGQNQFGQSRLLKTLNAFWRNEHSAESFKGTINFSDDVKIAYMPQVYSSTAARAEIDSLQKSGANFLLLDNPTTCLDLPQTEEFERALKDFGGTIIFSSKDRVLVETVANRIIDVTPNGTVDRICTYEEFLGNETVQQQIREKYIL